MALASDREINEIENKNWGEIKKISKTILTLSLRKLQNLNKN